MLVRKETSRQEVEEKLSLMVQMWEDLTGTLSEERRNADKAFFHFDTFESAVLNHEAFLQSQQSHFNFVRENPDSNAAKER